jgi:transcriptional regulator with XRE-family HTH domain
MEMRGIDLEPRCEETLRLDNKKIGRCIYETRKLRHLTQERLAAEAELSASYLGRVERGEHQVSLLTIVRLAKALDTTVDQLLGGNRRDVLFSEAQKQLADCTNQEQRILIEAIRGLKHLLREVDEKGTC